MKNIQLYNVAPSIPAEIRFLDTLARNLWWCWNPDAGELFHRIAPDLWNQTRLNPLQFLRLVPQERLKELATHTGFLRQLEGVKESFEAYAVEAGSPGETDRSSCVCYFSMEYGLHESVRMYSGGLGVLAGDHLKSASDLNLPLVAVGLLYYQGYFRQYLDDKARQQESYPDNEIHLLPLREQCAEDGTPIQIVLPMPNGELTARVWRLAVGRIPLYMLDTNISANPPEFRKITAQLYGGDKTMRLRQELLLGIGGLRALLALGYDPKVCHMNEGHAAFLSLGRITHLMQTAGLDKQAAYEVVSRTNVFTTHTPVPAGNETFKRDLLKKHLEPLSGTLGLTAEECIRWTRPSIPGGNNYEPSMTVLGLRMAAHSNGVSRLHGEVAREMWAHLWPDRPVDEVPIGHVTNGVHVASWLSPDYAQLFDNHLGPAWRRHPADASALARIDRIPNGSLWQKHRDGRMRLVRTAREHFERQYRVRNATQRELDACRMALDYDTLTIGFARRFATYKRATLLLRDPERFKALLTSADRPIQLVFAGKAHPADEYGKDFIRQIVEFARQPDVQGRVVFLEDYDINLARSLVQGVDVWLNTPRRPQEASGTSGMKAALNGGLNASILDGWWCEGYSPERGWAIGSGDVYEDVDYQDMVESQALYNLLENQIIPCFYDRPDGGVPTRWVQMMKASVRMALGFFTSHRMVHEYEEEYYAPTRRIYDELMADGAAEARRFARDRKRLENAWKQVAVGFPHADRDVGALYVGDTFTVTTEVRLGELSPEEIDVEVYHGPVDTSNQIVESHVGKMEVAEDRGNGSYVYRHEVACRTTGRYGFTARVAPRSRKWKWEMPGFMVWAGE